MNIFNNIEMSVAAKNTIEGKIMSNIGVYKVINSLVFYLIALLQILHKNLMEWVHLYKG